MGHRNVTLGQYITIYKNLLCIFYLFIAHWCIIKRFAINLICIYSIKYNIHYYFKIFKKIININILLSVPIMDSSLNIKNTDRTIDLHSQTTKITNKLVIENTGKSPVCNFICALDARQNDHFSYIFCFTVRA